MRLWLAVKPYPRKILGFYLLRTRNTLVAELFLACLKKRSGAKPFYTDGALRYPDACRSLDLSHEIHGDEVRSLMERLIQTVKDRTECFNDYFPCLKEHCRLNHVKARLNISSVYYNPVRSHMTLEALLCNPTEKPEFTTLQIIATKIRKPLT
jgi:putative transposase